MNVERQNKSAQRGSIQETEWQEETLPVVK